jgi:hypothetical protein
MVRFVRTAVALALVSLPVLSARGQAPPVAGDTKPQPERTAATRVRTDHLEILSHLSDARVVAGVPFTVVLDIKPRSRIHVYAPGATGYRVIEFAIMPMEGVTVQPVQYPPSEIYEFVPLNERIPVYQRPFQLIQSVTLDAAPGSAGLRRDGDDLTIDAALNYQACDDRICFSPVSVPLSWTVKVKVKD